MAVNKESGLSEESLLELGMRRLTKYGRDRMIELDL